MGLNNPTKSFSSFPFFLIPLMIIFFLTNTATSKNTTIPVNVGLVLDMNGEDGKIALSCINMSLSDFYNSNSHYKTRLLLNTRDSKGDVVAAAAAGTHSLFAISRFFLVAIYLTIFLFIKHYQCPKTWIYSS